MIAWFARNAVAANLIMITIIIGGILTIKTELSLEVFPDFEPERIQVSMSLRGATPEDIELGVTTRIEEALQDLQGIETMTSVSVEGGARVNLEVASGFDPREILDDVKSRVDAINTFPADAEKPIINLPVRIRDVITIVVTGEFTAEEILLYAEQVREDVLQLGGIHQVKLDAVQQYEISVETTQDQLRQWELSLTDISSAIRRSSVDISAGNLRTAGGDILIRSKGQAYRRNDFEAIIVKTNPNGSIVQLSEVARINDGFEEESVSARFNRHPAAFVDIKRVSSQNVLDVSKRIKQYIDDQQDLLPEGMTLTYYDDNSKILRDRLGILKRNAIQGGLLVLLLLALFLKPSIAFWVFIGIPVSFLGAFIVMGVLGVSLNVMSAFGFIVVLGLVVDDAIVTGENVYTHLRTSNSSLDAAIRGTEEVAIPVTFGVLTTIMAFLPITFIEGRMGSFFGAIPYVVIPVLVFSLIESKLVLPSHLAHLNLSKNAPQNRLQRYQQQFADGFENLILRYYQPLLKQLVAHRYATLASFIGLFVLIIALVTSGWAKFVFSPTIEGDKGRATLTMPFGTPFEVTDRHIQKMADTAFKLQEKYRDTETGISPILNILSVTGSSGGRDSSSNKGNVTLEVSPPEQRATDIKVIDLVNEWRNLIGDIPGAESLTYRSTMFRAGSPIDIQLQGNSLTTLSELGDIIKAHLANYPTVYEITDSLSDGKEEISIELTPQGHILGLTRADVASQVGQAFKGLEAQRIQRGRDDIRVIVRLSKAERSTLATLSQILISAPNGVSVPLANVATLTASKGPSQITRIDGYRVANVTAEVEKGNTNMTVLRAELIGYLDQLLLQYPDIRYSLEGEAKEQRKSFGSLQSGLLVVLFGIYCLLALPLRSYIQPLIVMSIIPFGIIGAVLGHWVMGFHLSIGSILGMLALIGVIVNDSLVLVSYINLRTRSNSALQKAVLEAGVARFRPVLLTSLTTFFGLLPLLLEKSISAQFLIPMAISLGFGILFATLITLIMVPANVLITDDIKHALKAAVKHIRTKMRSV